MLHNHQLHSEPAKSAGPVSWNVVDDEAYGLNKKRMSLFALKKRSSLFKALLAIIKLSELHNSKSKQN